MAKLGSGGQVTPLNYESGGRSSNLFGSASHFSDLTRGRRAVGRWSASVASAQRADLRPARAAAPKAVVLSASAFSPESDTTVGIQIVDLPMASIGSDRGTGRRREQLRPLRRPHARRIAQGRELPFGKRPFRVYVDPLQDARTS
jgi:hypothetical protein